MYITTYEYIRNHPDVFKFKQQVMISGFDFGFNGIPIEINNNLSPTITEYPKGSWIFPKRPFITYEPSDEEWCRYCRIGHEARGFVMGEIVGVDSDFMSLKPISRATVFDPKRMGRGYAKIV